MGIAGASHAQTGPGEPRYLGRGCAGEFYIAGSLRLGSNLTMYCSAEYSIASLYMGVSDRSWFGLSLPIEISQSRYGPCNITISPDVLVYSGPIAVFPNVSTFHFAIPTDPALVGPELFYQWHSYIPGLPIQTYRTTQAAGVRFTT